MFDEIKIDFDLLLIDYQAKDIYAKVVKIKEDGTRTFAGLEFTSISPEANMKIQLFVQLLVTGAA
jgi:adenylate cyclase